MLAPLSHTILEVSLAQLAVADIILERSPLHYKKEIPEIIAEGQTVL